MARSITYRTGKSPIHGTGVFACDVFSPGDVIGLITGNVIAEYEPSGERLYSVQLEQGFLSPKGEPSGLWRLNHCCSPNAELRTRERSVVVFAIAPIAPGDEITCDYRPSFHEEQLRCDCGGAGCSGWL